MPSDDRRRGARYMVIASFSFALMQLCVRGASGLPLPQQAFARNLLGAAVVLLILTAQKKPLWGAPGNRPLLLLRSILGMLGVLFYFHSAGALPMADASLFNRLSPFFVMLIAAAALKEPVERAHWLALAAALAGVWLMVRPGVSPALLPSLSGILGALLAGGAYVVVRRLRHREDPLTIVFFFCASSSAFLAVPTALHFVWPTPREWLFLAGIGLFALGGQFFLTLAYRWAPAGEVSLYSYTLVLFSTLLGVAVFREIPGPAVLAGMGLVLAAAAGLYRFRSPASGGDRGEGPRGGPVHSRSHRL